MLNDIEFANNIYFDYEKYIEPSLTNRRFKHSNIVPLIKSLNNNHFKVETAGTSVENREIYSITFGSGRIKILCWSQMHGDESTATMALFDVLNFFNMEDQYDPVRKNLLKQLTISFIPMLNPDGAETFSRRNKSGIDINRDALKLISPEAVLLSRFAEKLKPHFGFNMHDQDTHYTAGNCFKSAAISFLAPPFNREKSIDLVRLNAIKVTAHLCRILSAFVPGHIGRYPDDFEPRAFGDNIQKSGTSTVLVESGGWKDDIEKQFLRKLNFILLLTAFKSISEESFKQESIDTYENIPINETYLFDILLKNLTYVSNGKEYIIDIGINLEEKTCRDGITFYYEAKIADIGDLSIFYGYQEINLAGYNITPGKTSASVFNSIEDITTKELTSLHKAGYTNIRTIIPPHNLEFSPIPVNIICTGKEQDTQELLVEDYANFIIRKDGQVEFVVLNGHLLTPELPLENFRNALLL